MTEPRTPGLRERKKQATRDTIMRVAIELFAARGYDETSVEMIAAKAEVSAPTFFRYFGSKDEVLYANAQWRLSLLEPAVLDQPANEPNLVAGWNAVIRTLLHDVDTDNVRLAVKAARSHPVLVGKRHSNSLQWETAIAQALARRTGNVPTGEDHHLTAAIIMTLVRVATDQWADTPHGDFRAMLNATFATYIDTTKHATSSSAGEDRPVGGRS